VLWELRQTEADTYRRELSIHTHADTRTRRAHAAARPTQRTARVGGVGRARGLANTARTHACDEVSRTARVFERPLPLSRNPQG